jgi:hypothetical protein
MDKDTDRTAAVVPETIERELRLVHEAIVFVSSGGASRVVVGGIRFGEALLPQARQLALEAGVRIVPLWTSDEAGVDIAVERIDE